MSSPESSLPEPWIERIWTTMRATYGASFDRQWQTPAGQDPVEHVAALKAVWGRKLAHLQQAPHAIAFALDNLPAHPPTLIEFAQICGRRPEPEQPKLPPPKADPRRVAATLAGIEKPRRMGTLDWAYSLRERERRGEVLSPLQREMVRDSLRFNEETS